MNAGQIDQQYCQWSFKLHKWLFERGYAMNLQYFPSPDWKMRLFPGLAAFSVSMAGIPTLEPGRHEDILLPRPEQNPSQEDLDETFRQLCLSAARLLEIDLRNAKLDRGNQPGKSRRVRSSDGPGRPIQVRAAKK